MQRLAMGLAYFAAQSSFLRQIFVLLFSARDCLKKIPDRTGPAEAGESGDPRDPEYASFWQPGLRGEPSRVCQREGFGAIFRKVRADQVWSLTQFFSVSCL